MATQPVRVLLAEDEDVLRDFIRRNLQVRGFEVLEATNGLEALALWHTEQPQLIILDLMMPRLTGFEVCQRIREQSIVPIIVLTALDAERDKVMAFDLGADVYVNLLGSMSYWRELGQSCDVANGVFSPKLQAPNAMASWRLILKRIAFGEQASMCG